MSEAVSCILNLLGHPKSRFCCFFLSNWGSGGPEGLGDMPELAEPEPHPEPGSESPLGSLICSLPKVHSALSLLHWPHQVVGMF